MNITIPVSAIKAARKLLTRIHFERLKLPVLTHVLATIDAAGLTLAVTDLDHWLETRLPATIDHTPPDITRFLIPAAALAAAARGDQGSSVQFECLSTPGNILLKLTASCGRMPVATTYPPEPVSGFPERPAIQGHITTVPKETLLALQTVAGCASTDATRSVLNGVLFSPDDGGTLIATNGRQLAGAPARVTGREFILPNAAVHVLGFPDFTARDAAIQQPDNGKGPHIQFRSGPHTLIARTIEGNYPNYRQVIPREFLADATIPETHRPALISWLRSLAGKGGHGNYVRLTWDKPGHLTLTLRDSNATDSHIQVPVSISGESKPPVIAFAPGYLADALTIGPTLRLIDGLSPGMTSDPSGPYCVLMPCRCTGEDAPEVGAEQAAVPAIAA